MFLKTVKVKKFACSHKTNGGKYGRRKLYTYENENKDDVFHVVGVTSIKEGLTEYDHEYGYYFAMTESHKVYIVAKSIGRRHKVLESDLELIENN